MGKASNRKHQKVATKRFVRSISSNGFTIECSREATPEVFLLWTSALGYFAHGDLNQGVSHILKIEEAGYSVSDFEFSSSDTANVSIDFATLMWMHGQTDLVRWLTTKAIDEGRANSTSLFPFLAQEMEHLKEDSESFQVARELFQKYARFCAHEFACEDLSALYTLLQPHALSVMKEAVAEARAVVERDSLGSDVKAPEPPPVPPGEALDKRLRL